MDDYSESILWLKEIKKHLQPHPKIKGASIIEIDNELLKELDLLLLSAEVTSDNA